DEPANLELLPRRRGELNERLAGIASLSNDEMAQVPGLLLLVVADEPIASRPLAHGVANRVAEVGRQPAALDLEHLVPAPGLVEPERRPVLELPERVLELVAIVEDIVGRQ